MNDRRRRNLCAASLLVAVAASALPGRAQSQRSIRDGVFTESQASRGRQKFQQICTACHTVADYTGKRFTTKWADTTVGDLFDVMSNTMPEGNPGGLEPAEYAAIIAFILKESGYPEGKEELPAEPEVLKAIRILPLEN